MTQTRKWGAGAAVLVVLLLVGSWFLILGPKRSEAADLRGQSQAQNDTNQDLASKLQMLKAQNKQLPAQQAELAVIREQIPLEPAQPALIRSLTEVGKATGVAIDSLAPAAPVVLGAQGAGTQVGVAPGVQQIAVNLTVHGDFNAAKLFISKLEGLKRVMLVEGFTIGATKSASGSSATSSGSQAGAPKAAENGDVSVAIQAKVFMEPAGGMAPAGLVVGAPAPSPGVTPSTAPAK